MIKLLTFVAFTFSYLTLVSSFFQSTASLNHRNKYSFRFAESMLSSDTQQTSSSLHKLPVTVLSGFLGAGKTTMLKSLLSKKDVSKKYALIVNDMAELNIDASLIGPFIKQAEEKLVQLSNGCICCTLRDDLMGEIVQLAADNKFDHLIIESTGVSEPLPIAETFSHELSNESTAFPKYLQDVAEIDTMVTVVDCSNFLKEMNDADELMARNLHASEDDTRSITDLLVQQIEFANVVVLNKCDLVSAEEVLRVKQLVRALNSDAKIFETTYGNIDIDEVIGARLFDMEKIETSATWIKAISENDSSETTHIRSEAEEYGITSMVYRARKPFHPDRLFDFINNYMDKDIPDDKKSFGRLLRSKGFFWLATRWEESLVWAQAGGLFSLTPGGYWLIDDINAGSYSDEEAKQAISEVGNDWKEPYGDRRQEIVFIGVDMKFDVLHSILDNCMVTDEELDLLLSGKLELVDPFPDVSSECDHDHDLEEESRE